MDDLEFVQRCMRGDKQSWDDFVEKYSALIYNYIYSVLDFKNFPPSPETVDDLYQEIFVALIKDDFKKLRQFQAKNGASLASWLRIITINYTLDFLRRQKPTISLEESSLDEGRTLKDFLEDAHSPSADGVLLAKEKLDSLTECIRQLSDQEKYFLEMHIHRQVNLEDLKILLRISRSAVDMRKARIIQRLKECFRGKGFIIP